MNTKKLLFAVLFVTTPLFFFSCGDDEESTDTTGPTLTLNKPTDDEVFHIGETIDIDFNLEDESGINNYKVDIHWGEDHEHKSAAIANSTKADVVEVAWTYSKVFDDKKGQKSAHISISTDAIPDNTKSGHYHLGILATDLAGNETRKYIEIVIGEHID